jgi:hypothetical protein
MKPRDELFSVIVITKRACLLSSVPHRFAWIESRREPQPFLIMLAGSRTEGFLSHRPEQRRGQVGVAFLDLAV